VHDLAASSARACDSSLPFSSYFRATFFSKDSKLSITQTSNIPCKQHLPPALFLPHYKLSLIFTSTTQSRRVHFTMKDSVRAFPGLTRPPVPCKLPLSLPRTSTLDRRRYLRRAQRSINSLAIGASLRVLESKDTAHGGKSGQVAIDGLQEVVDCPSDDESLSWDSDSEQAVETSFDNLRITTPAAESRARSLVDLQSTGNCEICNINQPSPSRRRNIKELQLGALDGRQCCETILDAILTWSRHAGPSGPDFEDYLDEIEVQLDSEFPGPNNDGIRYNANSLIKICHLKPGAESIKMWPILAIFEPKGTRITQRHNLCGISSSTS
jgi:hypothetical protein